MFGSWEAAPAAEPTPAKKSKDKKAANAEAKSKAVDYRAAVVLGPPDVVTLLDASVFCCAGMLPVNKTSSHQIHSLFYDEEAGSVHNQSVCSGPVMGMFVSLSISVELQSAPVLAFVSAVRP